MAQRARLHQPEEPFYNIYKVEGNPEQFAHLAAVDAFVVQVFGREALSPTNKDEAEEIDGSEATEGQKVIPD